MSRFPETLLLPGRSLTAQLSTVLEDARRHAPIAGIDEAGRGPWAGPVVAAAVILPDGVSIDGFDDSKKLNEAAREALFETITQAACVGVGIASVEEIDRLNILYATFLAMRKAVEALPTGPGFALVDGNKLPGLDCPAAPVVKGDGVCAPIAAASIIAKVTRDRIMADLAQTYPAYGWESNKGYGTPAHVRAIAEVGVCVHHRKSFKPIRDALEASA